MSSCILRCSFLSLFTIVAAAAAPAHAASPAFTIGDHRLIMDNGYVHLEFNERRGSVDVLEADYSGQGHYGGNLLATNRTTGAGIVLETVDANGVIHRACDAHSPITWRVLRRDTVETTICIEGIQDRKYRPSVRSTWTLTLPATGREFMVATRTTIVRSRPLKSLGINAHFHQWFMNGFFKRGVVQYVSSGDRTFFTMDPLKTFYTMDNRHGSVSVMPETSAGPVGWAMESCDSNSDVGLEDVLIGGYSTTNQWQKQDWKTAQDVSPAAGTVFETSMKIYPNNYAFPVFTVPPKDPMPLRDLRTFYTAIYGSAAGVLGSFEHDGSAYPTLATPKRSYGPLYTFFDPDSWATVNALSFSGDPYLQDQARRIVELAGAHIKNGQVPHHFDDGTPTYIAISKATQTGPNIFWVLAAIDYVDATGDESWLREHYAELKAATDWVLDSYDPKRKLVNVGGPLFIDVFIRRGYTLDSNAMLLHLLPEMSAVAEFCGNQTDAARYTRLAASIKEGLNAGLWNGHDHYITQRNPDWSPRDMVDYDGNYAAVAFGAANSGQAAAIFRRLDSGPHTHPDDRGTWTSEKYYGPQDCFGRNTGDSATAMARIWWLDLDARYVTGDKTGFYKYFCPIQNDLFAHTWLTERYNAQGKSIRAPYYHEYPEITAMILREMIYGIDIKINRIRIKPFGLRSYHYKMGDLDVSYGQDSVSLHVPGHSQRTYCIYGLHPETRYVVSTGQIILTDGDGIASFQAPTGVRITIRTVKGEGESSS